jgi:O-antigen ligase
MLRAKGYLGRAQTLWWVGAFVVVALGFGWLIANLNQAGLTPQVPTTLVLVLLPLAAVVYLIKPHVMINLFIFVIPLLIGTEVILGLNLGELATLFIVGLGGVPLLASQKKLAEGYRQLRPLIGPLLGLAVVGLVSSWVNSATSLPEMVASVFKPLAFAIVTLLVFVHNDSQSKIQGLIEALLLGGAAVAVYSIAAYALGWSYYPQYGYSRAAGTFEHWNQLGGYMVLIIWPTLAYWLSTKHFWTKIFFLLAFLAEIVALLLSLTLGSIFSLLLSGLLAMFVMFKVSPARIWGYTLLLALAFLSVWLTNPFLQARLNKEVIVDRLRNRLATYTAGLQLAQDHFWFGLGSQDRVLEAIRYGPAGYTTFGEISSIPHNSFLSIWAEKGIFGLILLIVIVVNSLRLLLSSRPSRESHYYLLYQGIVVGSFGFLIQNMTNNLLLHARLGFIFFALVVAAVKINQLANAERESTWLQSHK